MTVQSESFELLLERDGERLLLRSPLVGLFTSAVPRGQLLSPGQIAGAISILGTGHELIVPAGATGRIVNPRPERVHEPVEYKGILYELSPLSADEGEEPDAPEASSQSGLPALRCALAGRFWHRPSPDAPAFVAVGDEIGEGHPVGLIEVMKTFNQVVYRPGGELPARARVVRVVPGDGDEVEEGQPLIEVEPAG